ncbi:MAG: hypothetical protein OEV17_08685, partial [Nitrospira sp.]|nr:hypothetical protein [Nitrospira sp.]
MTNSRTRNAWLLTAVVVFGLAFPCLDGRALYAQTTAPAVSQAPPPQPAGAPVVFADETLFVVYD